MSQNENQLLELLNKSEEYEDMLDTLRPELEIEPDIQRLKTLRTISSKLAIVVGHTELRPGALGVAPISMNEYFWNTRLAKLIKSEASSFDIECGIFYRDGIGIVGAYQRVENWRPNGCIELHFNAFNAKVKGTETLYGNYQDSMRYAQNVNQSMVELYEREGRTDRGIKERSIGERGGKNVNQLNDIPSCLIEPFFGDEISDAVLAESYLSDLARALLKAHLL